MKFTKEIVTAGKFRATDPLTNKRKDETISNERLNNWVNTFQKMKGNGVRIPAPFRHDLKIAGLSQAQAEALAAEEKEKGSLLNGGYWEDLFINKETGKLTGIIDVPDSLADKIGTAVKECSLYALPEWEDGSGNKYVDPILHIALVTHPVVTGQENFQPLVEANATALAMSQCIEETPLTMDTTTQPNAYYSTAKDILSQLGLQLPENVNADNILEYIVVAGTSLLAERSKNASNPGATDPATGLTLVPGPGGSLMSVTPESPEGKYRAKEQTKRLTERMTKLVQEGRISVETLNNTLMPKLTGCVMSLDIDAEGNLGPTSLDDTLDILEQLPAFGAMTGTVLKDGDKRSLKLNGSTFSIEGDAPNSDNVIDEDKAQSIIDQIRTNIGQKTNK